MTVKKKTYHALAIEAERLAKDNETLERVLHEVRDEAVVAYRCLQSDVQHVLNSESHFFSKWWHSECECDRLRKENAELRKLLTFYLGCLTKGHVNCDSCAISGDGDCDHGRKVIDKARELGIEVRP